MAAGNHTQTRSCVTSEASVAAPAAVLAVEVVGIVHVVDLRTAAWVIAQFRPGTAA